MRLSVICLYLFAICIGRHWGVDVDLEIDFVHGNSPLGRALQCFHYLEDCYHLLKDWPLFSSIASQSQSVATCLDCTHQPWFLYYTFTAEPKSLPPRECHIGDGWDFLAERGSYAGDALGRNSYFMGERGFCAGPVLDGNWNFMGERSFYVDLVLGTDWGSSFDWKIIELGLSNCWFCLHTFGPGTHWWPDFIKQGFVPWAFQDVSSTRAGQFHVFYFQGVPSSQGHWWRTHTRDCWRRDHRRCGGGGRYCTWGCLDRFVGGREFPFIVGRVFAIGRDYAQVRFGDRFTFSDLGEGYLEHFLL